jgi:hypothetical protein
VTNATGRSFNQSDTATANTMLQTNNNQTEEENSSNPITDTLQKLSLQVIFEKGLDFCEILLLFSMPLSIVFAWLLFLLVKLSKQRKENNLVV